MKQIIYGDKKGYLIPKKVVEDKLRGRFQELKDKRVSRVWAEFSSCTIWYDEPPKLRKQNDYYISVEKTTPREVERIVIGKNKFTELFELAENLIEIDLVWVKENKAYGIDHKGLFVDENELYYLFTIGDYRCNYICELTKE